MARRTESDGAAAAGQITPELIEKIARQLFRMLKEEIRIERERHRGAGRSDGHGGFA